MSGNTMRTHTDALEACLKLTDNDLSKMLVAIATFLTTKDADRRILKPLMELLPVLKDIAFEVHKTCEDPDTIAKLPEAKKQEKCWRSVNCS